MVEAVSPDDSGRGIMGFGRRVSLEIPSSMDTSDEIAQSGAVANQSTFIGTLKDNKTIDTSEVGFYLSRGSYGNDDSESEKNSAGYNADRPGMVVIGDSLDSVDIPSIAIKADTHQKLMSQGDLGYSVKLDAIKVNKYIYKPDNVNVVLDTG